MNIFEDKEVFQKYFQVGYDFNTSTLSEEEIQEIKNLAEQKRVRYALAPLGEKVFDFIAESSPQIRLELVKLKSDIDGMLYIPQKGQDRAYLILNGEKPLINQIFAAAHEYYHYIKDYDLIRKTPYVCNLSLLKNVNEKKASRFAAEFLLPENAIRNEMTRICRVFGKEPKKLSFVEYAAFSFCLTIKYQLPLKAVIYRLLEEGYIKNIDDFINNYEVFKEVMLQIEISKEQIEHLYGSNDRLLSNDSEIYRQMREAFDKGLVSREELLEDAKRLDLNMEIIGVFVKRTEPEEEENDEDDKDLMSRIQEIWREG